MKCLFAVLLILLVAAGVLTALMMPDARSEVPVIYWVTDPNPARIEQINTFHDWLIANGYAAPTDRGRLEELFGARAAGEFFRWHGGRADANSRAPVRVLDWMIERGYAAGVEPPDVHPGRNVWAVGGDDGSRLVIPKVELRLDTANRDPTKQIIQGVSGVAGDIMDLWSGSGDMPYFQEIGLLHDVTEPAGRLGFDISKTWPATAYEISQVEEDGNRHQYMFPCNVCAHEFWGNAGTLRKHGQDIPPRRWTWEEFERRGKAFVAAANEGKRHRDTFFANQMPLEVMHRGLGLSRFNETLTRCTLDDPRFVRVLELKVKWTYEDRILPSRADLESFATESGYGGSTLQLFNSGNYAMFWMGRYALIQLREFYETSGPIEYFICEPPHGGFPNSFTGTRSAAVYSGGEHKDLAVLFLAYLASEAYNMQIVADADALPPCPKYAETPQFKKPRAYPNEHGVHEAFSAAARNIAIPSVFSPFTATRSVGRILSQGEEKVLSDVASAEAVAEDVARRVQREIARKLAENPSLVPRYEKACALQEKIDERLDALRQAEALREAGKDVPPELARRAKKIPADWIANVFLARYYAAKGYVE